ncbi:MAG TPA: ABC transporter permease, partial [Thermomicrobiales bacterium]|nr:ABC transporter permease [Thermomicrobiales bacterium]
MSRYVSSRILQAIPALLGVTIIVFLLLQLSGDPASILLPLDATDADRAAFRHEYGLDQPLPVQYVSYMAQLARGDFGQSFAYQEPALRVVMRRLPATIELAVLATILANLIAVPAGILAALHRGKLFDRGLMALVLLAQSVPTFWLGMM